MDQCERAEIPSFSLWVRRCISSNISGEIPEPQVNWARLNMKLIPVIATPQGSKVSWLNFSSRNWTAVLKMICLENPAMLYNYILIRKLSHPGRSEGVNQTWGQMWGKPDKAIFHIDSISRFAAGLSAF